ncbi:MAG: aminopeptidase N [Propionibacteriaceae bacterium]
MFPANLTRAEANARSALIATESYRVVVDLTGRAVSEPETTFVSTSEVAFTAHAAGRTHIDLIGEAVLSASLDGTPLDPDTFADSRLAFEVEPGAHRLEVQALCRYSRSGEGLHRFVDPSDDRVYLYTQFEVSDARRVYACFEQPDLKARFSISVLAPTAWTVVSNGSVTSQTEVAGGFTQWDFATTQRISTYLTAVVAGDYTRVDSSYASTGGEVAMSIFCRESLKGDLDPDRIFATTTSGFEVFEEKFGYPYAFGKYDQVFVPEYNGGAMENAGCVTLRDDYIFRSRVTAASYEARDNTILHELSHMWFGDLVTMTWWDDLWLKESFAEFASHFSLSQSGEDPDHPWATFCNSRKNWAYRADQLPSTHPIAADMVDLEAVELNFDGITYAKGASVLRQLVAFVGLDAFLSGVRAYFAEHAYGNTELTDLLNALQKASGRDLVSWSAEWLERAGVNTLRPAFELADDGTYRSFAIEQTAPDAWPTLRSHRIAIGLYSLADGTLTRTARFETDITGARTAIAELVGVAQPDLVLVNDDDLTYAKVRLDERSLQTLVQHIHQLESPLARAVCWGAAWDMCRDAELPAGDYIDLALRGVGVEADLTAVGSILAQGLKSAAEFTDVASRAEVLERWEHGLAELLAAAAPESDHQLALAKAYAAAVDSGVGVGVLRGWLDGVDVPSGLTVDASLRWLIVSQLARLGAAGDELIEQEWQRDHTIMGAEQAAAARAARPDADAKAEAWRLTVAEDRLPNETHKRICLAFWQRGQAEVLAPYEELYLTAAEDISASRGVWATKGISLRKSVLANLFPQPVDAEAFLVRLDAWLASADLADSVRRVIGERRDDTLRALRCQAASALTPAAPTRPAR